MKKICVLSSNAHSGYLFFIPIVEWIWNKYGWDVALFLTEDVNIYDVAALSPTTTVHHIPTLPNVRSSTLAQTVRHFAANVLPRDAYIMVQDIDLLPLSNWWNPPLDRRSISGYPEMTGGAFIPVHYTGMTGDKWYDLMGCTGDLAADMERAMKENGRAYGEKWEQYWDTDWDILTQKVKAAQAKGVEFLFMPRRMVNGLPYGRVDRSTIQVDQVTNAYSWGASRTQPEYYDAHCESHNSSSPQKWANIRELLLECHPDAPIEVWDEHAARHYEKYGVK